jgi:hypothetical protein
VTVVGAEVERGREPLLLHRRPRPLSGVSSASAPAAPRSPPAVQSTHGIYAILELFVLFRNPGHLLYDALTLMIIILYFCVPAGVYGYIELSNA